MSSNVFEGGAAAFTTKYTDSVDQSDADSETKTAMKNLPSLTEFIGKKTKFEVRYWKLDSICVYMWESTGDVHSYQATFDHKSKSWGEFVKRVTQ